MATASRPFNSVAIRFEIFSFQKLFIRYFCYVNIRKKKISLVEPFYLLQLLCLPLRWEFPMCCGDLRRVCTFFLVTTYTISTTHYCYKCFHSSISTQVDNSSCSVCCDHRQRRVLGLAPSWIPVHWFDGPVVTGYRAPHTLNSSSPHTLKLT